MTSISRAATNDDLHFYNEGKHDRIYEFLGAHLANEDGVLGVRFSVWAPSADRVEVIGDHCGWVGEGISLLPQGNSGVFSGFAPGLGVGTVYKYRLRNRHSQQVFEKADPVGFLHECPPKTASIVWASNYSWNDAAWLGKRPNRQDLSAPMSIYELHFGSFRRVVEEDRPLSYREMADVLPAYIKKMGFTHVEFMPLMEHPFYGSWGYQVTGYFASTHRYGSPDDLKYLIDVLHQHEIGVILDWVPAHFPEDAHGLGFFDGTHLYEHADPRKGFHPDWRSLIFNYGRNEVRSFLLSSAAYWIDEFHVDALRVDGVASMLYLDYSRKQGEWIPNEFGGRENLEAVSLLKWMNESLFARFPGVQLIAEESTSWPMVSKPTYLGGLGYGYKWDMGWMHDTLRYFERDPVHRQFHHGEITFRSLYANHENFVLPLSHDEVVHGKGSILNKMPGDRFQKFANLRLLYAYMYALPGKKLLFMGSEFGQWREWNHDGSLDWHLAENGEHEGVQKLVSDLNRFHQAIPSLHEGDCEPGGFEWIDGSDSAQSVLLFLRKATRSRSKQSNAGNMVCAFNFTPVVRYGYRIGVPSPGVYEEIINTDAAEYRGSGVGNLGRVIATEEPSHGRPWSIPVALPPLSALFLRATE